MPATYEPLATTTLTSAASTITFTSIPSTYTDLRVVLIGTVGGVSQATLQFNSDTGSSYSITRIFGDGTTAYSTRAANLTNILIGRQSTNISLINFDVFSYAGSTYKTILSSSSDDENSTGYIYSLVGLWRSTAAINRIDISNNSSFDFNSGTIATLYGILKA